MKYYLADGQEITRKEMVDFLLKERGNKCTYPGCHEPFDDNKHSLTLDHIYPQSQAKLDGWEEESINGINNLQLMGKRCNSKKGNFIIDDDGQLPVIEQKPRIKVIRPELCKDCMNGRLIFPGDNCKLCGIGARPKAFPGVYKKRPSECSHTEPDHCWMCIVGHIKRKQRT